MCRLGNDSTIWRTGGRKLCRCVIAFTSVGELGLLRAPIGGIVTNTSACALALVSAGSMLVGSCSTYVSSALLSHEGAAKTSAESVLTYSLPRGLIQITVKPPEAAGIKSDVEVTPNIIADPRYRFGLTYDGSWLSSDALQLKTDKGLLATIWSKVEDRSDDIIVNLARAYGAVQGFTSPQGGGRASGGCKESIPTDRAYTIIVDPYGPTKDLPGWLQLDDFSGAQTPQRPALTDATLKSCARGVCTRSVKPWRVRITTACSQVDGKPVYQFTDTIVNLPDEQDAVPIDLQRALMVEKRFWASFDHGMITEIRLSKGSTAEELSRLPEGILRALVSVPTDLIQLRYNYSVESRNLTASELDRLKKEQALLDYLRQSTPKPQSALTTNSTTYATSENAGEGPQKESQVKVPTQPASTQHPTGVDVPTVDVPTVPDKPIEETKPPASP